MKFTVFAAALVAAVVALVPEAGAQTTRFYGSNGENRGSVTRSGDSYNFYDPNGVYQGHATGSGGGYNYYDPNGAPKGHSSGNFGPSGLPQ